MVREGYKQTEVGVIPVDWEVVEAKDHFQVKGRVGWKGYTKKDLVETGPYTIGAKHIDKENRLDLSDPTCLSREKYLESPEIFVEKGDILLVQRGSIGKLVYIDKEIGEATINPSMVILTSNSQINSKFVYQYFLSKVGNSAILDAISSTSVPMISQKQIGEFKLPFPTQAEQRAIATALSDTDALLSALDALIGKKEAFKRGMMEGLLGGERRLEGFSGEWVETTLANEFQIETGTTPSTANLEYYGNDYLFVSPADLGRQLLIKRTNKGLSKQGFEVSRRFPRLSTLFTCIGSTIGKTGLAGVDLTSNQQINAVFPNEISDPYFVYYMLTYKADEIRQSASEQAVPMINKSQFGETIISLPPLPEQRAIAKVLSDLDAELAGLRARRAKLGLVKGGMMEVLLGGEVRLV